MVAEEINPGWAAGIGQRSRVKKLAWALKGAPLRTKDLRLTAMGGIVEARRLRDKVTALMTKADASPEDAMVFCLFAEPDLSRLAPGLAELLAHDSAADLGEAAKYSGKLPIGFLVFVLDRNDPQQPILGHARPLIVEDPRGIELNGSALHMATQALTRRLMDAGVIPDERN
jgi:hypothetical protein